MIQPKYRLWDCETENLDALEDEESQKFIPVSYFSIPQNFEPSGE